jgi:hypothetical protein
LVQAIYSRRQKLAVEARESSLEAGAARSDVAAKAVKASRGVLEEGLALGEALSDRAGALKAQLDGAVTSLTRHKIA